ncbi:MAG: hypothetical protein MI919_12250, partial [Holophagales bacterium]|nr:hypothetical protein [Holophagales bacterium]
LPPSVTAGADLDLISPHGVADLGQGVWAATSPAGGALALFDGDGLRRFVGVARKDGDLATGSPGSLDAQALVLRRGERAFYEATRSGISCQSCHLHAATDHSPHDIGQYPLLPTLSVRGVTGTSPYLRDGSFPRVRDLHHGLAEPLLRGYRRYSASRPEDLESYVESLARAVHPAHIETPGGLGKEDIEILRRGWQAFTLARCEMCHSPPAFTNLSSHPARSLFPEYGADLPRTARLDTPSLLGIGAKDHWLQDGRARTLASVLREHNAANRHGDTAALTDSELRDLVGFLGLL